MKLIGSDSPRQRCHHGSCIVMIVVQSPGAAGSALDSYHSPILLQLHRDYLASHVIPAQRKCYFSSCCGTFARFNGTTVVCITKLSILSSASHYKLKFTLFGVLCCLVFSIPLSLRFGLFLISCILCLYLQYTVSYLL